MQKTILITGSTDGIGLATARQLVSNGHRVLLHGRNETKMEQVRAELAKMPGDGSVETFVADFSQFHSIEKLASEVIKRHKNLNVLINNAGVFRSNEPQSEDGFDVRFVVNTIAPYLLTRRLLPLLGNTGRVINVSSAAQSPVVPEALTGQAKLTDSAAYAQSKLALTMWSSHLALELEPEGPVIISVNPGSLLASKMVREAYGIAGSDLQIGAGILSRAALDPEFDSATGKYFDNDAGHFALPHPDGQDPRKNKEVVRLIESVLASMHIDGFR